MKQMNWMEGWAITETYSEKVASKEAAFKLDLKDKEPAIWKRAGRRVAGVGVSL